MVDPLPHYITFNNSNTEKTMTVAELISKLQTLPQDAIVRMSMNSEYECVVDDDMVYWCDSPHVVTPHVRIDSEGQDSWA